MQAKSVPIEIESTCDTVIPVENVIVFHEHVDTFDIEPVGIKRENAWILCEDREKVSRRSYQLPNVLLIVKLTFKS